MEDITAFLFTVYSSTSIRNTVIKPYRYFIYNKIK